MSLTYLTTTVIRKVRVQALHLTFPEVGVSIGPRDYTVDRAVKLYEKNY
jgi:hypothetical protein